MLRDADADFALALGDVCSPYLAMRPPRRMRVSEAAAKSLMIVQPGGSAGPWSAADTPYMVEPVDSLASRRHEAVLFAGPARTGKTMGLLDGWVTHAAVNDPGDFLIVQMTQDKAREFSRVRIDRAIRNSPDLRAVMSTSGQDDNTHDKQFKHGMWLRIAWPTVSNLSGSDYRYVALTDLDRMPDDIGGEGAPFLLALKRIQTFLSRGMCMAESSPGRDITDPHWKPATPHEAPPVNGILGYYNLGDRRCWYWRCPDCGEWFWAQPGLSLFNLPDEVQLLEDVRTTDPQTLAAHYARVTCPHCGTMHSPKAKSALNAGGIWVPDGMTVSGDRVLSGPEPTSKWRSYWLGGVAAAYQSWHSIIGKYLQGLREYALAGTEETLKVTTNTDQGCAYMPMILREAARESSGPADRVDKSLERFVVPEWARFIVATVDVQGGTKARFEVQVHAFGPYREKAIIDRYAITESFRPGIGSEFAPIDPAAYPEDWDVLTERVLRATYRTPIDGKELRVLMTAVDTGGEHKQKGDGVTDKAYAWLRRLRKESLYGVPAARRVMLVKGANGTIPAGPIKETMVGQRGAREHGDVPMYLLDTDKLKDIAYQGMSRRAPGPGYLHLGAWLPKSFFDELHAEVKGANGKWTKVRKRNEAFDLLAYAEAVYLRLGCDRWVPDWDAHAAQWARPLESNSELIDAAERREMQADARSADVHAALMAPRRPVQAARPARRRSMSPYLSGR